MRWRFTDHIELFHPWTSIQGRKSISLEEYSLLKIFGMKGLFPRSLVIESCVQLACWLTAKSSDFKETGILDSVAGFEFEDDARMGDVLSMTASVAERDARLIRFSAKVTTANHPVCQGMLAFSLAPLDQYQDPETMRILWRELYAEA
ncbi:MAG: hypothetical protein NTX50_23620 [Candidatus Sumerlaeota bacterium]|nr:hypothetical protein [Candidatus Sumerlaeota bacterium]